MKTKVKRLCFSAPPGEAALRAQFNVLTTIRDGGAYQAVVDDFAPEKLNGLDCQIEHLNLEELFLIYNAHSGTGETV